MKRLTALASLGLCSLIAGPVQQQWPAQGAYDYDLFSKDRECEFFDLEGLALKLLNNQPIGTIAQGPMNTVGVDPQVSQKIVNMNWNWQPGFRLTLGYFNAPKYWEVLGQYTWFKDKGSKRLASPGSGTQQYLGVGCYLPSVGSYGAASNPVTKINASAELFYNDLSTLVSRNFYPNPHLRLKVIGGLTSMWTHQTTDLINTFYATDITLNSRFHSKYWGVGFKMGTGADWYWGKDFYLTGKVFWSIVTGRWNTNTQVSLSDGTLVAQPHDSSYRTSQNFQFIFGPSYQKSYEKTRLEIFVGYEFNSWLGALSAYNYQSQSSAQSWLYPQSFFDDLTLAGVNIRLTLDF
jgi:hypothetical protein